MIQRTQISPPSPGVTGAEASVFSLLAFAIAWMKGRHFPQDGDFFLLHSDTILLVGRT
jgi:hypothetical protein